jgi:Kef-type K+ transport system membrane component KefB
MEQLFLSVVIILAVARILGELFRRIKQPAFVGELLAGIIIGPVFGLVQIDDGLTILSHVAVFFLMLLAGLEINLDEIRRELASLQL